MAGSLRRRWAVPLLLALMAQFAGPITGAASAVVGPFPLPLIEQQTAAPSGSAAVPGAVGVEAEPTDCPTEPAEDVAACVGTEADEIVDGAGLPCEDVTDPTTCAPPEDDPPCNDTELACAVMAVRDEVCGEDAENPEETQCLALGFVITCLDDDAAPGDCDPADVVTPAAAAVCGLLDEVAGEEQADAPDEEDPQPTCEEHLQSCDEPTAAECKEALGYLQARVENVACSSVDCAPIDQLRALLACQDQVACGFQAVWDGATPIMCDLVGGESEADQSTCEEEKLGACDEPVGDAGGGCADAAEYLQERLDATACDGIGDVCLLRDNVSDCDGDLACAVTEVRDQECEGDPEASHCTALDLVINCLDADACTAGDVVAPAAEPVCATVAPDDAATCEQKLQDCANADSAACEQALEYLREFVRAGTCSLDEPVCTQVWELVDCEGEPACVFQAVWDGATPVMCDLVGGESEADQSTCEEEKLGACDDPVADEGGGCADAAEYLQERLDATTCASADVVCLVRQAAEDCAAAMTAETCEGALYATVTNALCAAAALGDCPPPPARDLRDCIEWVDGSPQPDGRCARDVVLEAVCEGVDMCLLEMEPVAGLIAAGDDCADSAPDAVACGEGLRRVALGALCADAATCIEGLEDCPSTDAVCHAVAVWNEVCPGSCPPELQALGPCIEAPAGCATPPFLQGWIWDACQRQTSASTACPTDANVGLGLVVTAPDGSAEVRVPFENGSTLFPYREVQKAFEAIRDRQTKNTPGPTGPVKVGRGTYKQVDLPDLENGWPHPDKVELSGVKAAVIDGSSAAGLTLRREHPLKITGPITILGTPAIAGPEVEVTATVMDTRVFIDRPAVIDSSYQLDDVATPEPVVYQLSIQPSRSLSADALEVTVGGAVVTPELDGANLVHTILEAPVEDGQVKPEWGGSSQIRIESSEPISYTVTTSVVGKYTEVVYDSATTPEIRVSRPSAPPTAPPAVPRTEADATPPTTRLSGEDRSSTAAAVSRASFPDGAQQVFVATGSSYADALGAGPAAASSGSPVVLVERDRLPEATRVELHRLKPSVLTLVGGTGAISAEVERQLAELADDVSRVRGDDRYATAAAVSAAHFRTGVPVAYVASGEGFADALSGGAAAAALGGPVLLVQRDAVPAATDEELRRLAPGRIVVLGGTQAVSQEVEEQLGRHGADVRRVSGATRYATSAAVSRDAFDGTVHTIFVATGATFPDALAGVPAAGAQKAPLMLVEPDRLPREVAAELDRLQPKRIVILGGEKSVTQRLERELRSYQVP